ncbi:hypothetical protein KDL01_36595 [Actinospica durhamensis]|uniref:AAA+ ATPase domain-containing protein n=1 Tax=Actinospica durhamensis TaxID=1508375 RepID=A0A941ISS0_9ACTN|nr:AAA family ATPase [Actinospica durhamensis]MBR7838844.1 hypothetical protein [Actinospica durhamensis]
MLRHLGRTAPITGAFFAAVICVVAVFRADWPFLVGPLVGYLAVLVGIGAWHERLGRRAVTARHAPIMTSVRFRPPAQLPPQPLFVGRRDELDAALAALRSERGRAREQARVVLVTGQPGIGKTAFAIKLAHEIAPDYPGGSLFARITDELGLPEPAAEGPAPYLQAFVSALASAYGATGDAEGSVTLRTLTSERRILFVVDDVQDESELTPLLHTGPGCTVIATSRRPLTGLIRTHEVLLDRLHITEAVDLLTLLLGEGGVDRVAEREGAAQQIVQAAGLYPLAVRMAANALSNAPYWSLSVALERLTQLQREEVIEPFDGLDVAYALLADEERTAVDVIGALDARILAPWTLQALLAAVGTTADDERVLRILDALARARFLELFSTDAASVPLFRVHDQVLNYARRMAERRGADHVAACRLAVDEARAARSDFALEHSVAQSALDAMAAGELDRALRLARDSVSLGRENHDTAVEASGLVALAEIQTELGGTRQAEELVDAARELTSRPPSAHTLRCAGKIARRLRTLDRAAAVLQDAVDVAVASGDEVEFVFALRELAVVFGEAGRSEEGIAATQRAEATARAMDSNGALCGVLWARGRVLVRAGENPKALDTLTQADQAARESGRRLWQAWIAYEMGRAYLQDKDATAAAAKATSASRQFTAMKHEYGVAYCEALLGESLLAAGETLADAARVVSRALNTFQRCGDPWVEAETACVLASIRSREGHRREAARLLGQAVRIYERLGDHDRLAAARRQASANVWRRRGIGGTRPAQRRGQRRFGRFRFPRTGR